jgi:hypothetical protein
LVHFLLLGGLLFLGYRLVRPQTLSSVTSRRIDVTSGDIDQLSQTFARQWRRAPTAAELKGMVDDLVREQVLYREALAMGLDRDDAVIRRRLAQKFQFLTDDLARSHVPSDAELERFLASHREHYAAPPRLTFSQLYFSNAHRGERARSDAASALRLLLANGTPPAALRGDPFLAQAEFVDMTPEQIGRTLGAEFGTAVAPLTLDQWSGPVESSYGWHLVRLERRITAPSPTLAAVRDAVQRDWEDEQRKRLNADLYRRLLARYDVVIHPPSAGDAQASTLTPSDSTAR